jgi:hypothetical protein
MLDYSVAHFAACFGDLFTAHLGTREFGGRLLVPRPDRFTSSCRRGNTTPIWSVIVDGRTSACAS